MRTIFITSFHVLVSRNILLAPFLKLLIDHGWRVVLIMPRKKEAYFKETFSDSNIVIEGVDNRLNRLDNIFKDLALAAIRTDSLKVMRARNMGMERPLMQKIFFWAPLLRPLIPFFYRLCMPKHSFHELFEKYKPAVVFSTDVFSSNDCRLLLEASAHHVPTVGMVRSWDNLTTKGGFRAIPDILAVQNDIARGEAMHFHGIVEKNIRTVGIPHYDNYKNSPTMSRKDFLKELNIPHDARYIVYAPLGDRIMKVGDIVHKHFYDAVMIEKIAEMLPPNTYLVVRFPPTDTVTLNEASLLKNVRIERPGVRFGEGVKGVRASEMGRDDDIRLANTLKHAEMLINPFSSLAVDAAFLDCPVIIPYFDPRPVGYWEDVRRLQDFEHFRELLKGGVAIALDLPGLKKNILGYLADKKTDHKERMELAERECYTLDYRASERLFAVIEATTGT